MSRRKIWQCPQLHFDEERAQRRPTTWLELFFDLFLVVAVAQLSGQLSGSISWPAVGGFTLQFLALFWLWVGITFYNERFETEGIENRLIFLFLMGCVAGMAVFAQHGLGEYYYGYVLSYLTARIFTFSLWIRAGFHNGDAAWAMVRRFAWGFGLALIFHIASFFQSGSARLACFAIGLIIEALAPLTFLQFNARLPKVSTSKHPERFGLFTLVVLGETVTALVTGLRGARMITSHEVAPALLSLPVCFGMWWVYFDFVGRRPFKPVSGLVYAWVYAHFALFLCIVAAGAGLLNVIKESGAGVSPAARWLAGGSVGGFLLVTAVLELLLDRRPDEPTHPRLSPGLKLACAPLAFVVVWLSPDPCVLLPCLSALLLVQVLYGVWVWFTQEIQPGAGPGSV